MMKFEQKKKSGELKNIERTAAGTRSALNIKNAMKGNSIGCDDIHAMEKKVLIDHDTYDDKRP
jgi:hypothetical protein